jgi:hypothetical protein
MAIHAHTAACSIGATAASNAAAIRFPCTHSPPCPWALDLLEGGRRWWELEMLLKAELAAAGLACSNAYALKCGGDCQVIKPLGSCSCENGG